MDDSLANKGTKNYKQWKISFGSNGLKSLSGCQFFYSTNFVLKYQRDFQPDFPFFPYKPPERLWVMPEGLNHISKYLGENPSVYETG